MSITCVSSLTVTGPCTRAKATYMKENTDPDFLFHVLFMQTCYLMLKVLLTHFFIAILFII